MTMRVDEMWDWPFICDGEITTNSKGEVCIPISRINEFIMPKIAQNQFDMRKVRTRLAKES